MNPAGADVAITDTVPPTLVTQLAPNRATAGQATTTAAPGGPSAPCGDNGLIITTIIHLPSPISIPYPPPSPCCVTYYSLYLILLYIFILIIHYNTERA